MDYIKLDSLPVVPKHVVDRLVKLRNDLVQESTACMDIRRTERAEAMYDAMGMLHAAAFDIFTGTRYEHPTPDETKAPETPADR